MSAKTLGVLHLHFCVCVLNMCVCLCVCIVHAVVQACRCACSCASVCGYMHVEAISKDTVEDQNDLLHGWEDGRERKISICLSVCHFLGKRE